MKPRSILISSLLLALALMACSFGGAATPAPASSAGDTPVPTAEPLATPTKPPLAPGTQVSTPVSPTPTSTAQVTATVTTTATATATKAVPIATAKPVSTGPLDFTVSIVSCRLDPSRNGGVVLTIRIDARGGNGVYTYYSENKQVEQVFERPATKGTAIIDAYRIESGDGQTIQRKERFVDSQFGCP